MVSLLLFKYFVMMSPPKLPSSGLAHRATRDPLDQHVAPIHVNRLIVFRLSSSPTFVFATSQINHIPSHLAFRYFRTREMERVTGLPVSFFDGGSGLQIGRTCFQEVGMWN